MVGAFERMETSVECKSVFNQDISDTYVAVYNDHPEYFYLSHAPRMAKKMGFLGNSITLSFNSIFSRSEIIYAIIIYIQSFINACKSLGGVSGRNKLTSILLKWWHLFKVASLNALKSNFSVAHSAIIKSGGYRFLSFKKWMWFIVAPTVLIFGTAMIFFVAFLQLLLLFAILYIILTVLIITCVIYLVIAVVYAMGKVGYNLINAFSTNNPLRSFNFTGYFLFSDLGRFAKEYFLSLFRIIADLWSDSISLIGVNFAKISGYSAFNPIRFFYIVTPVAIIPITILFIALLFIIISILFIPAFIAEFLWAIIAKIKK